MLAFCGASGLYAGGSITRNSSSLFPRSRPDDTPLPLLPPLVSLSVQVVTDPRYEVLSFQLRYLLLLYHTRDGLKKMTAWKTLYGTRLQTFALYLKRHFSSTSPTSSYTPLEIPTIIYVDNHLLVVAKPAGWHSVPNSNTSRSSNKQYKISVHDDIQSNIAANDAKNTKKCLLTHLKQMKYGGGSHHDFLLPLHRLDQPCTGVLMFGKTSKAASRVQRQWSDVKKTYLCVLQIPQEGTYFDGGEEAGSFLDRLYQASVPIHNKQRENAHGSLQHDDEAYFELSGSLIQEYQHHQSSSSSSNARRRQFKKTVEIQPFQENVGRPCRLEWRRIQLNDNDDKKEMNKIVLLQIKTNQGRRHMIRALLSQVGHCPIAGDLRYAGGQQGETSALVGAATALPDQSVALHAHTLQLPTSLQLGNQLLPGMRFTAPIPRLWKTLFGITDNDVSCTFGEHD